MRTDSAVDAVVVGAGPNGLAAAVTLARAGLAVRLYEREATAGGGARTAELTLPGFRHDVCSAVHPLALSSGFFRSFGLTRRIGFAVPEISYAHPLDGRRAGIAYRDLDRTADALGSDGRAWRGLFGPLVARADEVAQFTGSHLLRIPAHPLAAAWFGARSLELATPFRSVRFSGEVAPAMLAGIGAHAIQPIGGLAAAGAAFSLGVTAHARGWPVPLSGSQSIVDALVADLLAHGGELITGTPVGSLAELPPARAVLLDVSPKGLLGLDRDGRLPRRYRRALARFRYGPGAAKVDFALAEPVPWAVPELAAAGTLHLGGTRSAIAAAEAAVAAGRSSDDPYVLVAQPSAVDATRAPEGRHVLWAYTHVPHGSRADPTEAITRQIERFAPGFRDVVLASAARSAERLAEYDPNYVGGDIAAGAADLRQLVARPVLSLDPWRTPLRGVYLCSSSTPPGPGVHGLSGWYAARRALAREFGIEAPSLQP
ncbi:NAD(P)/FAD-dependent oxidoreductase [Herbiconiux moechotypicola]|uniref:NAD(P)/FAD-dependent oxidoreductase n=1 Tax=Herbiconiux moechotypicola TaxID=637393 RepID=A0ABN3E253_9MICO|nr:NAD(P)/FAD-dependent oxidoreductase [Herbiconiux moechotypicola]MCS5731396.1 NAD(P)/FAD-dependent oxidoreductase [Herbiconiux moechotypicola]